MAKLENITETTTPGTPKGNSRRQQSSTHNRFLKNLERT